MATPSFSYITKYSFHGRCRNLYVFAKSKYMDNPFVPSFKLRL